MIEKIKTAAITAMAAVAEPIFEESLRRIYRRRRLLATRAGCPSSLDRTFFTLFGEETQEDAAVEVEIERIEAARAPVQAG
jgi:hypothetical protein